jgi:ElaB/YqjD/DUF883 family membrane-anchored ribosome-binding protein
MFNLNKDNLNTKVEALADNSENLVNDASDAIKSKAREVSADISDKTDRAKSEANHLIAGLKALLTEYSDASKINQLKEQFSDKAHELKSAVSDEVSNAYYTGKQKATETVKENPLGTLALVAGAGLVIGFIFGTRQSK